MKSCPLFFIERENNKKIRFLISENIGNFLGRIRKIDSLIILSYSTHRPEIISIIRNVLPECDLIFLEEPFDSAFYRMLSGDVNVEDYISERDFSFPDFQKEFYRLLKSIHDQDKEIVQIDPYMSCLMEIHEVFAKGGTHRDFPTVNHHLVYSTEKTVSANLVKYYSLVPKGNFNHLVRSIMDFARSDAMRIKLRDEMRAEAIVKFIVKALPAFKQRRIYIEAGYIHQPLFRLLSSKLDGFKIVPYFPVSPIVRFYMRKKHVFSPGDILTLRYLFNRHKTEHYSDDNILLAARSLIYTKIIRKDEIIPSRDLPYPHTLDEIECHGIVSRLSVADCREVFGRIRYMATEEARREVLNYISTRHGDSCISGKLDNEYS